MREEFNEIYEDILDAYVGRDGIKVPSPRHRAAYIETRKMTFSLIDQIIRQAHRKGLTLRSDAELFLKINLHQMVALPLELDHSFTEVKGLLAQDIRKILHKASVENRRKRRERDTPRFREGLKNPEPITLTGGDVLKAIAGIYDQLALSDMKLWGG